MDFRRYETLILLSPNLSPDQIEAFKTKIGGVIDTGGGKIVRFDEWGRRRLAYPVKKELYGYYVLYDYRAQPPLAAELQRNCKIDEQVFKYLTLILERDFSEQRYEAVLEQLANEANRREKEKEGAGAPEADKTLPSFDDSGEETFLADSDSDEASDDASDETSFDSDDDSPTVADDEANTN
ncbi:MAG: 30S ribosomal protein S6 [Deltaproteobacteria bacterium]|jgi:small subunit ribosomal protein S6|nr:30S ribosomal protein S6 [Deltaproteobacteria bacterium]